MIKSGYNSNVRIVGNNVYKTSGSKLPMSDFDQAQLIVKGIWNFEQKLTQLNIYHPKVFSIKITGDNDSGYSITTWEERIKGKTVGQLLIDDRTSDKVCIKLCREVLNLHMIVRASGREISLDPPLANFMVPNNNHNIYYVDLMPPRQQAKNKLILEFQGVKKQTLISYNYRRHFTDFQFRVIFVQMCRNRIRLKRKLERLFKEIIPKNCIKYIMIPKNVNQIFNVLNAGEIDDIDYLRNISLELLFQGIISKKDFGNIYSKTHIAEGTGETPNRQILQSIRGFLITNIKK